MNLSIGMMRLCSVLVMWLFSAGFALAQEPLSLAEAVARARASNPDAAAAAAGAAEAAARASQARAARLPRLDWSESWQKGNQPVFVFSSLLSQRRFTEANFAIEALNRPPSTRYFRTAVVAEQPLWRAATREAVAAAAIAQEIAEQRRASVSSDLAVAVTSAYGRAVAGARALASAAAALEAATTDRALAANRREAGMATDADVLLLEVHLARAREQEIRARVDQRTARAELNQLIGAPLDTTFSLVLPAPAATELPDLGVLRAPAYERPSVKIAALGERLAAAHLAGARGAFLPQVVAQAGWEFNGAAWTERSSSWVAGITGTVNLFRGLADRARLAEARAEVTRAASERRKAEDAAALDVYAATARLEAARASEVVARAAVAQAREAHRIVRDRYENGLADVAALLRSAESLTQSESQHVAAQVSVLVETASLQRALGQS